MVLLKISLSHIHTRGALGRHRLALLCLRHLQTTKQLSLSPRSLVSSPSLTVLHLPTYIHTRVGEWVRVGGTSLALSLTAALCASLDWQRGGRGDQPSAAAARARAERMAKCSSRPLQRRMQVTSDPPPPPHPQDSNSIMLALAPPSVPSLSRHSLPCTRLPPF